MAQSVVTKSLAGITFIIETLGKGLESLINLIPGMNVKFTGLLTTVREEMVRTAETLDKKVNAMLLAPRWGEAVGATLADVKAKSEAAAKAAADLAKKQRDLARSTKQAIDPEASRRAQESMKKYAETAGRLFSETRTPAEKYRKELEDIKNALFWGDVDPETARRAAMKAQEEVEGGKAKFGAALEVGSTEAYSAVLAASGAGGGMDQLERNTAEQVDVMKDAARTLRDIKALAARQPEAFV
jgi:hypothetical protein